jgi:hypothetical protein
MADDCDAKLSQIFRGQVRKNRFVDFIIAKRLRVLLQTDPAKPTIDVQDHPCACSKLDLVGQVDYFATAISVRIKTVAAAATGYDDAAPPSSVMNSRRRMSAPTLRRRHCNGSNQNLDRG